MAKNENATSAEMSETQVTEKPKRKYTRKTAEEKAAAAEKKKAAAEKKLAKKAPAEKPEPVKEVPVEKNTTKKASKKPAEKKVSKKAAASTDKEFAADIYFQYKGGEKTISDIIEEIKKKYADDGHRIASIKNIKVYVKPEENAAYYLINDGKYEGKLNLF